MPPAGTIQQPISITPNDLYDAYKKNEASSDEKFRNKQILLRGNVSLIVHGALGLKQANTEWFRGKFLALSLAQG